MKVWRTDEELFTIIRQELFTCVVGDVMDKMGLQHQFLPPRIRPLRPDMVVIGRAMPVLSVDVFEEKATDRKSTRLNSSHGYISYAVFCLKKKKKKITER